MKSNFGVSMDTQMVELMDLVASSMGLKRSYIISEGSKIWRQRHLSEIIAAKNNAGADISDLGIMETLDIVAR